MYLSPAPPNTLPYDLTTAQIPIITREPPNLYIFKRVVFNYSKLARGVKQCSRRKPETHLCAMSKNLPQMEIIS